MKKILNKIKNSILIRLIIAFIWTFITGILIINLDYYNTYYILIPLLGFIYVSYITFKLIIYAWIINPLKNNKK